MPMRIWLIKAINLPDFWSGYRLNMGKGKGEVSVYMANTIVTRVQFLLFMNVCVI